MFNQYAINEIIDSYYNGQIRQMVEQIDNYGLYDIWSDLRLQESLTDSNLIDMVIAYHKVKYR